MPLKELNPSAPEGGRLPGRSQPYCRDAIRRQKEPWRWRSAARGPQPRSLHRRAATLTRNSLDEVKFRHLEPIAIPIDIDTESPEDRWPHRLVRVDGVGFRDYQDDCRIVGHRLNCDILHGGLRGDLRILGIFGHVA